MSRDNPWRKHRIRQHRVLVADPHIQSPAAQVMLRIQLLKEAMKKGDEWDYYFWMGFRSKWLGRQRKEFGILKCFYCNKQDLKIETKKTEMLATIDHWKPVARGGGMFDEQNLRVACNKCNQAKADKMPEEIECISTQQSAVRTGA